MELAEIVRQIMNRPSPQNLWELYGELLNRGWANDRALLGTVQAFQSYLCDLQTKIDARRYSELASLLDMGAVGGVALQNLLHSEGQQLLRRALLGTLSESLMVLASRQYVKGWSSELHTTHCQAAWVLAGELWELSSQMQPDLKNEERWQLVDKLLEPARLAETPNELRIALLGRLFQIALLNRLIPHLIAEQP